MYMGKSRAKAGGGKAPVQQSLEQTGQLPLLKKPGDIIWRSLKLFGLFWGAACPPADTTLYCILCAVCAYTAMSGIQCTAVCGYSCLRILEYVNTARNLVSALVSMDTITSMKHPGPDRGGSAALAASSSACRLSTALTKVEDRRGLHL